MAGDAKHSPEPWRVVANAGYSTVSAADARDDCDEIGGPMSGADARRIVACVNALAGVPTEALEAGALAKALDLLAEAADPLICGEHADNEPGCWGCRAVDVLRDLGEDAP